MPLRDTRNCCSHVGQIGHARSLCSQQRIKWGEQLIQPFCPRKRHVDGESVRHDPKVRRPHANPTHAPPSTTCPDVSSASRQTDAVAPVVHTSSTKTTRSPCPWATNVDRNAANLPSLEAPVKDAPWRTRVNRSRRTSRPHDWARPSASASVWLNPRFHRRRQWIGTGTRTHCFGGEGWRSASQRPSERATLGNPPYFIRWSTSSVPKPSRTRTPATTKSQPSRSCTMTLPALPSTKGHLQRHAGHTPATSFGDSRSPHVQHPPRITTPKNKPLAVAFPCHSRMAVRALPS